MTHPRKQGLLRTLRHAWLFASSVSCLAVVAIALSLLRPAIAAAQLPPALAAADARKALEERPSVNARPPSPELELSKVLDQLQGRLADLVVAYDAAASAETVRAGTSTTVAARQDPRPIRDEVLRLKERVAQLVPRVEAGFDELEILVERHTADPERRQRQQQTRREIRENLRLLRQQLDVLERAKDAAAERAAAQDALASLVTQVPARPHQAVDPEDLPFRRVSSQTREPRLESAAFEGLLARAPSPEESVAAVQAPPVPEDTQATPEVQITPEIEALAASLGNDPLTLYTWVHDNIRFVPTYGAFQGSRMTLEAKRGNAADTASLLLALLRAAGVPSRFVAGTIDVPVDRVLNWLGGVPSAQVAQQLLGQGGIPNVGLLDGGEITHIRLEHVWVEAWVDFVPGRGRSGDTPDTWVPLDASFKQLELRDGSGALESVPFDGEGAVEALLADAEVDQALGRISAVDHTALFGFLEEQPQRLGEFLGGTATPPTPEGLLGEPIIVPSNATVLPASLPYRVLAQGARQASLPPALRHAVRLRGFESSFDRAVGATAFSYEISLPALNSGRLGLTYEPATEADATALQGFIDDQVSSLPLYLIDVRPVVTLDGEAVASGGPVTMGSMQLLDVVLVGPGGSDTISYQVIAGDESVIGLNGNGITEPVVAARLDRMPSDTSAENLHQVALHYWMQTDYLDQLAASGLGVFALRRPSVGLFISPLSVATLFGVPRSGVYQSRVMDVKRSAVGVAATTDELARTFVETSGFQGSYMEGSVFDQLLGRPAGRGISAMQLLFDAALGDIPVYEVTSANVADVLPRLNVSQAVKNDVANSVNAGKVVIVPERQILHDNYVGVGYIVRDPVTGAGGYLISGGLNGGGLFDCLPDLRPLVITILSILLIAALIWWLWPFIAGALAGLAAPGYATAMIAFLALLFTTSPAQAASGIQTGGQADPCNCPPPPPPPPCEIDRVPPSRPHWPCPGDHWHYRVYNQGPAPECRNFLSGRLFGDCIPPPLPVPCPPI